MCPGASFAALHQRVPGPGPASEEAKVFILIYVYVQEVQASPVAPW